MAQSASSTSSTLSVAITRDRTEYLTGDESDKIQDAIHKQIISEACSTGQDKEDRKTFRPIFNREPHFENGAVTMWCEDDQTLAWLNHTVSTYDKSLVVMSPSQIQKRHICEMIISDKEGLIDLKNIGSVLSYQNPWIDFKRWEVENSYWEYGNFFIRTSIPEDQVLHLMKAGRLSIGLMTARVKFLNCDVWSNVPAGWDPKTEQFLKKH